MEIWFGIFAGIMAAVFAVLFLKIRILQKAAREIEHGFAEKLKVDTNTLMELSCNDRHMRSLAEAINIQLRELQKQRHQFRQGDLELKNAVLNISHDLRTPLTAVCGYLDLLEEEEAQHRREKDLGIVVDRKLLGGGVPVGGGDGELCRGGGKPRHQQAPQLGGAHGVVIQQQGGEGDGAVMDPLLGHNAPVHPGQQPGLPDVQALQLLLGPDPAHRVVGRAEDKRLYVLLYDLPLKLRQVDGIHPRLLL